ncbi:MAG: hypothetical protein HY298_20420 [Verrucomicrobia bacterium]|nr:hypothetical protein [Verrucomicrobiota bacterium]
MTETVSSKSPVTSVEEIQQGWHELKLRVGQLEAERSALEQENKALRFLLERVIEHRQKSHSELVLLLSGMVSKLPINDVGVIVSKLVEHNKNVSEICATLAKGKADADLPQPEILKALDQTKRDLVAALKPAVDELIQLDTPLETAMLRSLVEKPELFFSPAVVRANRCFVKGQVARERIVREFGEEALSFFNDMTTDPKLNPRPKSEEIVLTFKNDFEALFQQNTALLPDKRAGLLALYQRIQRSKGEPARAQKNAFYKLSFLLELLHYYENQNTETPEGVFAQRLPVLIEHLVVPGAQDDLDEQLILQAEGLLAFVTRPEHRLMIANNVGKTGRAGKTLRYVLKLRLAKSPATQNEIIPEFVKHLLPSPQKPPPPPTLAAVLRLLHPDTQRRVVHALMDFDKLRREEAEALGRALAKELGLTGLEQEAKAPLHVTAEMEREMAWGRIKAMITGRDEPAAIAAAIRDRLRKKYESDEIRQSWMTLIEADAISLIRIFCQLPYLPDGSTDPIAQAMMGTYVMRLTHEKYAATYIKVVNSLKNMFKAKSDSPTLLNFIRLVKWVDAEAAKKLSTDIGMAAPVK